ncbi:MAG: SGNH/GDSL hydrolase family protein [Nitrospinota bacterium]
MKSLRPFLFSAIIVIGFFGFIETFLHLSGFQPTISYKKISIPAWMGEFDPIVLAKYQKFISDYKYINEDAYAYQPDLRYDYLLKPGLNLSVSNYSSSVFIDKLPAWTIASDSQGNRISAENPDENGINKEGKTIHVLGDSSSFGWGVNFEESYPQQLASKLSQFRITSRVVIKNYSTPGFSSFQGRLLLEDKVEIKRGDIALVSFGFNDSYESMKPDREYFQNRNSLPGKISWYLNRLLMVRGLRAFFHSFRIPIVLETDNRRVSLSEYRENLGYIFSKVLKNGGKPLFVNICNGEQYSEVAEKVSKNFKIPFFNFPEEFKPYLSKVHDIYPEKFVAYYEAYGDLMEKKPQLAFLFPDYCHPNAIGHRLIADVILKERDAFK